ncbi:MAG: hypothetical protein SGI92_30405 [Bryobacteraceae bacterium]|nr:hypothetical protein [Bryobacteraceae bacterium]
MTIFVQSDASDFIVAQAPVEWAINELQRTLREKSVNTTVQANLEGLESAGIRILIAPASSEIARRAAREANVSLPSRAESLGIVSSKLRGQDALLLTGADTRGLVYAILELTDRVRYSGDPVEPLTAKNRLIEQPANEIRSVQRLFVSDVEDKGWYNDKSFWGSYLSMLAAQRFNRFSLTLGLGYDLPHHVLDSYFIFSYPFLLKEVPGYKVTVPGLPTDEPERNLEMLKWISAQAAARGLHFQLSLWSQTYKWIDSPKANYVIEGLNDGNHALYCRDALKLLIKECPAISGITLRAHSESGIGDGSYDFWKAVFSGIGDCGRRMEIDLHSKGIEHRLIQMALDTGQPVRVSTKYTAEHMGLPGHQIAIRELERTQPSSTPQERAFTRYGYADYLAEDRPYGTYFRLWPGKDRVVLWGDPAIVAGYGRYSSFCGGLGLEMCEPMAFKGRQGSGLHADRRIYADQTLAPEGGDFQKYLYTYRLWGRHLYNPDADPESYRRYLRAEHGAAAAPVELSLASASKVIPLVTSSHLPSAAGMSFWPEIYSNMPVADEKQPHIYGDTPSPKVFGRVSALDPGLFMTAYEYVDELTGAPRSGRYTPADVAGWLDGFASKAEEELRKARAKVTDPSDPSFRRVQVDVEVQLGLGRFFAAKMRSAVAWALYQRDRKVENLRDALFFARSARNAWVGIVKVTKGVYLDDLTFGEPRHRRGSWSDRLPSIERDVQYLERLLAGKDSDLVQPTAAWLKVRHDAPACKHVAPASFTPGQPLNVAISTPQGTVAGVRIKYRHVNQAESYQVQPMAGGGGTWNFTIPGEYTNSRYSLQYHFQLVGREGTNWLYPGLDPDLANQPYFVVRRA